MRRGSTRTYVKGVGLCLFALLILGAMRVAQLHERAIVNAALSLHPPPGQMVDIGNLKLHLVCSGEGRPTVVLESGFGGWWLDWRKIQPTLARRTRTCAYDRAGHAYSDPARGRRTAQQLSNELYALLQRAEIPGPYLLVGHSFGAHVVRLFTNRHPGQVFGLVLVDPALERARSRFTPAMARATDARRDVFRQELRLLPLRASLGLERMRGAALVNLTELPPSARGYADTVAYRPAWFQANMDELAAAAESEAQVEATRRRRWAIPLVVLSRTIAPNPQEYFGVPAEAVAGFETARLPLIKELASLSDPGRFVLVEGSSHAIQMDRPEAVIEAVNGILDRAAKTRQATNAAESVWTTP